MNQAILKIIDEEIKIYKSFTTPIASAYAEVGVMVLEGIRDKISSLPSDTQWIDVNERLPEKSGRCLVYGKANEEENGEYSVGFSDFSSLDKIFIYQLFGGIYKQKVTHWMPLPLPPNN